MSVEATAATTEDRIRSATDAVRAGGASAPVAGRDPINGPMIANWTEAIGDANPIYRDEDAARAAGWDGVVAPPAMAQVWTMRGLHGARSDDDPLGAVSQIFDDAGYTSVVATNCDSTYHRYTRPGEHVAISSELLDVVGPKTTGLGEGWFFTTRNVWTVGDEVVAEMNFRILKFRPPAASPETAASSGVTSSLAAPTDDLDAGAMMRPSASRDTAFFWTGVADHELRIQRRPDGTLVHPPVPALWKHHTETTDYQVAAGTGTVYSFVVHHAPRVPGRTLPFVIALVELDEGVRMLGQLRGVDPAEVAIGMPVVVEFLDFPADPDATVPGTGDPWTLYAWQPADSKGATT
ncbi:bifunctional MaoC family dehydratase N-terminal/OB-fold nucleic acid binding domain-containing protein [Williamsia sp.]|uniref:bifunctional MaoC family dehydratase N-terminal/OB-fold nucleic acid binding domain-containing protein n=1 Tax=Williamsia sp. TaxID=1872085 RepID=UPI001A311C94|nr:bifunctional MaoC family dehydratase N-terminal/OB-fold nucleic acid binding domain-containing protein [Williamsia sp.]MBJ7288829.1 bifunctional MaoC family dehydratase/OB-fold nucleic acid binding domain-containing protein [Williamsia sp.]